MTDHADTIRRYLAQSVPDGFRDEDGVWHGGPHRQQALAALDALLAERQQAIDALRWLVEIYETRRGDLPRSIQDTDDAILRQAIRSARAALVKLGEQP